jgi:transposase
MSEPAVWIGIDVAKAWLDVAEAGEARPWRVENDAAGIASLVETLAARPPQLIVLEPTGGLETAVTAALLAAGLPVAVVNPAQVRAFATASGQRAKTDVLDARLLARFGQRMQPLARPLPDATTQELRAILARRRQLREMHTAELNRRSTTVPSLRPELETHLAELEAHLAALDAALARLIAASPAWQAKEALLCSIPGIGPVVAHAAGAFAGAGHPEPPGGRGPGRGGPAQPRQWPHPTSAQHRWGTGRRASHALYGGPDRGEV